MMEPRQTHWHEVLIITGGLTPQVVTETVYALVRRASDPLVPAKIVCAVTGGCLDLFGAPLDTALERLQRELGIEADWRRRTKAPATGKYGLYVEAPRSADGRVIADIRSGDDAVRFGDFVSEIVRRETLYPKSRVHLSLAGGRKTMSFHGGMAISLFGRAHDELSHVLVHPREFEQCPDFWFPTQEPLALHCSDGKTRDVRDCGIELAPIPFIQLREALPWLSTKALDYASYVRQLYAVLRAAAARLELTTCDCRVRIGDVADFALPNSEFALYQLMAEWKRDESEGAGPLGLGPGHRGWMTARMFEHPEDYDPNPVGRYIAIYAETFRLGGHRADDIGNQISPTPTNEKQRRGNAKHLREWKSRLVDDLQAVLHHPGLADRFGAPLKPVKVRPRNRVVFGLRLDPHEIVVRPEAPLAAENEQ
jgi:CRISPR-associated protein (TIGR02584 family)